MNSFDVLIIGGGPAGLAAAIAAKKAGLTYLVIEKGALVNSLLHYPTEMVFFTTPELMEIGGLPFTSPNDKPSRMEALRYYRRVTDTYDLAVAFDETVTGIDAQHGGGFTVDTSRRHARPRRLAARAIVMATGAYDFANLIGVPGEDLPHVSHYYTAPHPFYRKRVVIVGGKNSAAEAALDLFRAGAQVTLVHRRAALGESIKYWVKPDIENRIREGSIAARFDTNVVQITPTSVVVEKAGVADELPADQVFLLTGYISDNRLLRAAGVEIDPETCGPRHDSATYETNVPGLYVIGAMVAGKASGRIFIENGRFHGQVAIDQIARSLSGDRRSPTSGGRPAPSSPAAR
jgi:thioredoxin reductase (NADPH)